MTEEREGAGSGPQGAGAKGGDEMLLRDARYREETAGGTGEGAGKGTGGGAGVGAAKGPACAVKVKEVSCRSALSKSGLTGLDYALNPYRGCEHGCLYCYAPAVLHYDGKDRWGCFVEARTNIPVVLAHELRRLPKGMVGVGTVTDPYQPAEMKYRLTRHCLEQLLRHQWPVCVQTKSRNVVEDLELLRKFEKVEVGMTVTTDRDAERACFEPGSSTVKERVEALRILGDAGVPTFVFFGPVLPGAAGDEKGLAGLAELFGRLAEAKVGRVLVDRLRMHPGVWERLRPGVMDRHPELAGAYEAVLFGSSDDYERLLMDIVEAARSKGLSVSRVERP